MSLYCTLTAVYRTVLMALLHAATEVLTHPCHNMLLKVLIHVLSHRGVNCKTLRSAL